MRRFLSRILGLDRAPRTPRTPRTALPYRPAVEALEDRRVMSADPLLLVYVRQSDPVYNPLLKEIYIDGSMYDDTVEIQEYAQGANGYVKVKLEQRSAGVLLSSRTVQLNTPNLNYHVWPIRADLKDGNDTLYNNTAATMFATGGNGNDYLYGGSQYDHLQGNAGNDFLAGRDGSDGILAGDGNDVVYCGNGDDFVHGDAGNDIIVGESGNDQLQGDAGDDYLFGGTDNDSLWGGDGADLMYGEAGHDFMMGNGGADKLYGGDGNDYMDGGYGERDYLQGGLGADTFVRHKRVFWYNDPDVFSDYNSATGDRVQSVWHA